MHDEIMDCVSRKISNCITEGFDHTKVLSDILQQNIKINYSENIQIICAGGDSVKIARYV